MTAVRLLYVSVKHIIPKFSLTKGLEMFLMKRKMLLSIIVLIVFVAGTAFSAFATDYFDESDLSKGLLHVTYTSASTSAMKVMIEKDTKRYTYDVNSIGVKETFPLQLGDGDYKISLLQNTTGNSYKFITSKTVTVKITDPNSVYLGSIQNVNWSVDSAAVKKAVDLTKGTTDLYKKAQILWSYMANNNKYNYTKLATLKTTYVPVIDATLRDKNGICYDFSSLYAAMLRSQGIPAKLVKGYAPNYAQGYHAWNEAYDSVNKKWVVIDSTYDLQVIKVKPSAVSMIKKTTEYQKVYEY